MTKDDSAGALCERLDGIAVIAAREGYACLSDDSILKAKQ